MSEASESAARLPTPERAQYTAGAGSRRRAGQQARVTNPWLRELERAGRFVGAGGSTLAIVGFALPIGSGWFEVDGYDSLLLLLLRGDWADTSNSIGGLGWALIPLVFMLSGSVLAWPITFSLMAEPATQRFPRLSLVVFVLGCLVLWNVVGATFCLAATLGGLVAFVALTLLMFRNPARSHPWMYALVPLAGLTRLRRRNRAVSCRRGPLEPGS